MDGTTSTQAPSGPAAADGDGPGGRRWRPWAAAFVVVALGATAAAAWWWQGQARHGGPAFRRLTDPLSTPHTLAWLSVTSLDSLAATVFGTDDAADAARRQATDVLGGDPASAETWRAFGVDPDVGATLVVDARVVEAAAARAPVPIPLPVLLFVQPEGAPAPTEQGAQTLAARLVRAGATVRVADDGRVAALRWPAEPVPGPIVAALEAMLEPAAAPLSDDPVVKKSLGDIPADSRLVAWLGTRALHASAKRLRLVRKALGFLGLASPVAPDGAADPGAKNAAGATDDAGAMNDGAAATAGEGLVESEVRAWGEHLSASFPAAAFSLGSPSQGARLRVVTSAQAGKALAQIVRPTHRPVPFARLVPQDGWAAVRASLNLRDLADGLVALTPPSLSGQVAQATRAVVAIASMSLGVGWSELGRAFSGHVGAGVDLRSITAAAASAGMLGPIWVASLGVADAETARSLLERFVGMARSGLGGVQISPVKVGDKPGWQVALGPMTVVAVVVGQRLVLGPSTTDVQRALDREAEGSLARSPAAAALDGDVMVGLTADRRPLGRMASVAAAWMPVPEALSDIKARTLRALAAETDNPLVFVSGRLDNVGVLWETDPWLGDALPLLVAAGALQASGALLQTDTGAEP